MDPEGFIVVNGLRLFYRSEGEPRRGTVLGLHGGPGGTYDYLTPLFDLVENGYRAVISSRPLGWALATAAELMGRTSTSEKNTAKPLLTPSTFAGLLEPRETIMVRGTRRTGINRESWRGATGPGMR